jgi:hypothetical protein
MGTGYSTNLRREQGAVVDPRERQRRVQPARRGAADRLGVVRAAQVRGAQVRPPLRALVAPVREDTVHDG